jgi:hypothetical protein
MPNLRRITPSLKRQPALVASRVSINKQKLCYILVASRKLQYPKGRSCIAYIGTTKKGLSRVAGSVAHRADSVLRRPGINSFEAHIVTTPPRQKVRTWLRLEGCLLTAFYEHFGALPKCNDKNGRPDWTRYRKQKIERIIEDLS